MIIKLAFLLTLLALSSCAKDSGDFDSAHSSATITVVNNRALLSWQASGGLPDGYYVEQSSEGAHWNRVQTVTELSTYLDGLTSGTTYFFRVQSFNSTGTSAYTSAVTLIP
jgi:hypothetical protein